MVERLWPSLCYLPMGATQEIIYKNYLDIIRYHLIIFLDVNKRIRVYVSVEGTKISSTLRERETESESCLNQIAWTFAHCNLISYLLSLEFCQKCYNISVMGAF